MQTSVKLVMFFWLPLQTNSKSDNFSPSRNHQGAPHPPSTVRSSCSPTGWRRSSWWGSSAGGCCSCWVWSSPSSSWVRPAANRKCNRWKIHRVGMSYLAARRILRRSPWAPTALCSLPACACWALSSPSSSCRRPEGRPWWRFLPSSGPSSSVGSLSRSRAARPPSYERLLLLRHQEQHHRRRRPWCFIMKDSFTGSLILASYLG